MVDLLNWVRSRFDDRRRTTATDERDTRTDTVDGAGHLFECPDCAMTFISDGMESCPACGAPVETVATETDLGYC